VLDRLKRAKDSLCQKHLSHKLKRKLNQKGVQNIQTHQESCAGSKAYPAGLGPNRPPNHTDLPRNPVRQTKNARTKWKRDLSRWINRMNAF
jgi:hypothetical protein